MINKRYADRVKELKRGGSGNSGLSKEDRLAKQLMLPRRNKNSKKIIIQKKKVGGPVFQKFDVKGGMKKIEKKDDESKNKITPVKPITPKGMLRPKAKSKRDNGMMGMFYSKKDLLRKKKNNSGNNKGRRHEDGETKEEMMYRILKNKGKKRNEPEEEEEYSEEEEIGEERRDFESYKNKFYRKKEKKFENPKEEGQGVVRKSNSMLPSNNTFLSKEESKQEYGRESDIDLMNMELNNDKKSNYLNPYKNQHKKNPSSIYGQRQSSRDSSNKRPSNKSRSMKPNKKVLPDPFKDFEEREKKYDKDILREILELEDMFTQDYSRHIDSMVGLVKKDIAMQANIRDEKGPMRFEESISKVKKIVQSKRDSLDLMMAAIRRFDEKFEQLKIRKEKMSYMKPENRSIKYTRPTPTKDHERMRPNRNMQGSRQGELLNSKSMYGLGMNPSLKPLHMNSKKPSHYEYKYQGFGGRRNGHQKDKTDNHKINMMMKGVHPNILKEKMNLHPGSSKELRPIAKDRGKQKFSMLPQMNLKQRNLGDEEGESYRRKRTDTETTKDLMNDLDIDNDLSLI